MIWTWISAEDRVRRDPENAKTKIDTISIFDPWYCYLVRRFFRLVPAKKIPGGCQARVRTKHVFHCDTHHHILPYTEAFRWAMYRTFLRVLVRCIPQAVVAVLCCCCTPRLMGTSQPVEGWTFTWNNILGISVGYCLRYDYIVHKTVHTSVYITDIHSTNSTFSDV